MVLLAETTNESYFFSIFYNVYNLSHHDGLLPSTTMAQWLQIYWQGTVK